MIFKRKLRLFWEHVRVTAQGRSSRLWLYPAWWKLQIFKNQSEIINSDNFFTAIPNRGAGIGHQISNWQSGLWFALVFGLRHAHVPFAQHSWERFLGYGATDPLASDLKKQGYLTIHLPLFDENDAEQMLMMRRMISQYNGKRVVFYAEQDQSFREQFKIMDIIRERFYLSPVRKSDLTPFSPNHLNIAIHLRRGDIVAGQTNGDPNLTIRWLDNDYYRRVLDQVLLCLQPSKEVHIYIFSQGCEEDFIEFITYPNIHFFLDLNPESTFLSFVYADVLITSKSSFSYKPALLNKKGIKVCPRNFWHGYPDAVDWILAEDNGDINMLDLSKMQGVYMQRTNKYDA